MAAIMPSAAAKPWRACLRASLGPRRLPGRKPSELLNAKVCAVRRCPIGTTSTPKRIFAGSPSSAIFRGTRKRGSTATSRSARAAEIPRALATIEPSREARVPPPPFPAADRFLSEAPDSSRSFSGCPCSRRMKFVTVSASRIRVHRAPNARRFIPTTARANRACHGDRGISSRLPEAAGCRG